MPLGREGSPPWEGGLTPLGGRAHVVAYNTVRHPATHSCSHAVWGQLCCEKKRNKSWSLPLMVGLLGVGVRQRYIFLAIQYAQETMASETHDSSEEMEAVRTLETDSCEWAAWRRKCKRECETESDAPGRFGLHGGAIVDNHVGPVGSDADEASFVAAYPLHEKEYTDGDWLVGERAASVAGAGQTIPLWSRGGALENVCLLLHKFGGLARVLLAVALPATILLRVVAYQVLGEPSQLPLSLVLGTGRRC